MKIFLIFLFFVFVFFAYKKIYQDKHKNKNKNKNKKIYKFKNKLLSKESNIEKIFLREEEKISSNPNLNIHIGLYESEENINRKSNIHRARLSKFSKSKLNGEMIYINDEKKIFKYINGKKFYL